MATKRAKPIPEGFHTVTAHLTVKGAGGAIEYYKKAFGAEELFRMPGPNGTIMHSEIRIGDSTIMVNDEFPEHGARGPASIGGSPVTLHLYVPDVDAVFDRAVKAGAKVLMPVTDMFWGDRYGQVEDPYGHRWSVATHTEDLTPEETMARAKSAGF
jgi:PhnB protein